MVWLHSLENLIYLEGVDHSFVLCFGGVHKPCLAGASGAGGQDSPASYSSSLQPFGKEGNAQDIPWKRSQGIWHKSYPCYQKTLAQGRAIGLHRGYRPSGAGVVGLGPGEERGSEQGAAGGARFHQSEREGSIKDSLPRVPREERLVIRQQILPLPLFGIKAILLSRPPSSDEGRGAAAGSQKVQ